MKIQKFLGPVLAITFVILCVGSLYADIGDLDPTFDGDGKVTTDLAGAFDEANAAAIQPDGKIVVAGIASVASNLDFGIARYNPNGSLDNTFDSDGKVTTDFDGDIDQVLALAIQSNGRIVAAGGADVSGVFNFALARYNSDGSLDLTFDGDGKVTTSFGGPSGQALSVVIQTDGKIIAAGFAGGDFCLTRYNSDGSLDTTFGFDGIVITDFGNIAEEAKQVVIQPNGKIVVAGRTADVGISDFALARYNPDGSPDLSFGLSGKVTTDFAASTDSASALALQTDGKLVAGGGSGSDFALARYNSNGTLDVTFNSDGKVTTDFDQGGDFISDLAIQPDGNIVAAGGANINGNLDFALARYNTDGSLDTNFNFDGRTTTDFGETDSCRAVLIQTDGKIVAAGSILNPSEFAIARYIVNTPPPGIFSDDYEDGILATDWTYVKPNWTESGGNLIGTPTGKKAEVIATPAFDGCTNCTMNASMQTAGGEGNKLWFLTWFLDKKNTVEVLMKEENDKWIVRQRVNGSVVAKSKGLATILPDVFYNVQVTFDGINFTLIVDGATLATLPAIASPNGTLGFRVKNTTGQFGFVTVN